MLTYVLLKKVPVTAITLTTVWSQAKLHTGTGEGGDFPGSGNMKYRGPEVGMSLATRRLLLMELWRASM